MLQIDEAPNHLSVRVRPLSKVIVGSHDRSLFALEISGRRLWVVARWKRQELDLGLASREPNYLMGKVENSSLSRTSQVEDVFS